MSEDKKEKEAPKHKLYKDNGDAIEVNDNSLSYCLDVLKWTKTKPKAK